MPIDSDDGDFFLILGSVTKNPVWALILFLIGIGITIVGLSNESECETKPCPPNMSAKLLDHQCVCVMVLKP